MSNATSGYLLPPGEAYTDDIKCTLVFYPDKDEYRRALLGSLDYLGTWLAWQRDPDKRGQDAARSWKAANELTWECWQMSCLDQLQSDVATIKNLLANMVLCCDGTVTYGPPTEVDTDIVPGVGDPPATYGQTEITTWDEWNDYVCYNANRYVDFLVQQAESFASVSSTGGWTMALVASALALLSFTGIGLPVAFALASTVLFGLLTATSGIFDDVAEDIEDSRNDIICAFLQGTSLETAVGDAIGTSNAAWLLLFSHIDYDSATAIIYAGGYGDEYLPAIADSSCECEEIYDIEAYFTFDTTTQGWELGGADATYPGGHLRIRRTTNDSWARCPMSAINTYGSGTLQAGHTYRFVSVTFSGSYAGTPTTHNVYVAHCRTGGTIPIDNNFLLSSMSALPTWTDNIVDDVSSIPDFVIPMSGQFYIIQFGVNVGGSTADFRLDNIRIRLLDVT